MAVSSNLPFIELNKEKVACVTFNSKKPSAPLAALEKLRDAAEIRFKENDQTNIPALIGKLSQQASKINGWTKFWDSIGHALFSCFGFKTTTQKVNEITKELNSKYKVEDEKKNPKGDDSAPEAESKAKEEAEQKAKQEADQKAKEEAEQKAKQEAEQKAKEEAELKAKQEAEQKAKEEAELKAKQEAEQKAKEEAELKAKQEAEQKAKEEAELKAKQAAEEKAKEDAQVDTIIKKFDLVLKPQALFDIGSNSEKIKTAINEIDENLKTYNDKVKNRIYAYLARLNHYQLAKSYGDRVGIVPEDPTEIYNRIQSNVQATNFTEAKRLIESVRFIDLKNSWSTQLSRSIRVAELKKRTCNDSPEKVKEKFNSFKIDSEALTYIETLKKSESRDTGYALLIEYFTNSYAKAKEYADRIEDDKMRFETRKQKGLLEKDECSKVRFASSSIYGKLTELENPAAFDASLHLILSMEYARECIQKGEWLIGFEIINKLPFEDLKADLLLELEKIPNEQKLKSIQKLNVAAYSHDRSIIVFLQAIPEKNLKEAAALLFLPKLKKRAEALFAVELIQDIEKRKEIKFQNGLLTDAETVEFIKGKPELKNPLQMQKDLINEITRLIEDYFFDEAQIKIDRLRYQEDKESLSNRLYQAQKKVRDEFDETLNQGKLKATIQSLKEQKGSFQKILVDKFFEKVKDPNPRLEALAFIRDEKQKEQIRKDYAVYTEQEWDRFLTEIKDVERDLTNNDFARAKEKIEKQNYAINVENALKEAIDRRAKPKSILGFLGL